MNRHVDIYCERLGPGLWAEPLNALSNLAFILAGIMLLAVLRRQTPDVRNDPGIIALVGLVLAIGIGSGLFHTFAVVWAGLADVIPIALFVLLYLYLALRRLVVLPFWGCLLGLAIVLVLVFAMPRLLHFSGSTYGVSLAAMLGVGGFLHFARRHPAGLPILYTGMLFGISLAIRTADMPLCEQFPIGVHYIWHCLNAVVLYRLTRTMMRFGPRPAPATA